MLAIMKKIENGGHFINIACMEKFQITDLPPKFGFSECRQKQNISVGHYEKFEKWLIFHKYQLYRLPSCINVHT